MTAGLKSCFSCFHMHGILRLYRIQYVWLEPHSLHFYMYFHKLLQFFFDLHSGSYSIIIASPKYSFCHPFFSNFTKHTFNFEVELLQMILTVLFGRFSFPDAMLRGQACMLWWTQLCLRDEEHAVVSLENLVAVDSNILLLSPCICTFLLSWVCHNHRKHFHFFQKPPFWIL